MPNPAPAASGETGWMQAFNPEAVPVALLLLLGTVLAVRLLNRLMQRLSERITPRRLLIKQINTLLAFTAYVVMSIVTANKLFTLSPEAIFALSGTIAVTVGFALKDVAASFMAGISILITKPFQVGDRIHFGGYYGEVKEIGLRTVKLVTLDDQLVTIPSNKFLTDPVASANAGELDSMVVIKAYISLAADHRRAKEIMQEAVLASQYLYLEKPFTVIMRQHLCEQGQVLLELTAKAYVYDTRFEEAFESDVSDRTLTAFRKEDITIQAAA